MFKNKNFILTIILPIIISIFIGIIIIVLNSNSILNTRAVAIIAQEKEQLSNDFTTLQKQKKDLEYTAADLDKKLEDNRILLEEITALNTELDGYNESITSANETIAELDKAIQGKTKYNDSLNNLDSQVSGTTKKYTNIKLNVPSDINAGRYKAEGTGKLYIYTIAGTLEDKQDLSILDSHSYSFNINSGQYIKIEGALSLTEILN